MPIINTQHSSKKLVRILTICFVRINLHLHLKIRHNPFSLRNRQNAIAHGLHHTGHNRHADRHAHPHRDAPVALAE